MRVLQETSFVGCSCWISDQGSATGIRDRRPFGVLWSGRPQGRLPTVNLTTHTVESTTMTDNQGRYNRSDRIEASGDRLRTVASDSNTPVRSCGSRVPPLAISYRRVDAI